MSFVSPAPQDTLLCGSNNTEWYSRQFKDPLNHGEAFVVCSLLNDNASC